MSGERVALSIALTFLRIAIFALVVVGIWRVGEYSYKYCYGIIADTAMEKSPGRDVRVSITADMSGQDTAKLLKRKGLVKDAGVFYIQLKVNDYDEKLLEGTYVLNTSMTPTEIMAELAGEIEEDGEGS